VRSPTASGGSRSFETARTRLERTPSRWNALKTKRILQLVRGLRQAVGTPGLLQRLRSSGDGLAPRLGRSRVRPPLEGLTVAATNGCVIVEMYTLRKRIARIARV